MVAVKNSRASVTKRREAAILLLTNHEEPERTGGSGQVEQMCVVPGEVRAT